MKKPGDKIDEFMLDVTGCESGDPAMNPEAAKFTELLKQGKNLVTGKSLSDEVALMLAKAEEDMCQCGPTASYTTGAFCSGGRTCDRCGLRKL